MQAKDAVLSKQNTRAFVLELYHTHYDLVYRTIVAVMHEPSQIEDLVNDTFVKLIEKIPLLHTLEQHKRAAYIFYTARSIAINFIRRRDLHNKHLFYTDQVERDAQVGTELDILDQILKAEEIVSLREAVLKLPEQQKDLLYFKYMLEMPDVEIAKTLKISSPSVRQYLTRARRAAKRIMNGGAGGGGK